MKVLSRLLIVAAVVLAGGSGTGRAQQNSLIEPDAMAALTRMGGYQPQISGSSTTYIVVNAPR